jgi:ketosteroid isomerase-like protein
MPEPDELIQRITKAHDAFNRGDYDAAIEIGHPDVVVARIGAEPELRGIEALRKWMEPDALENQVFEIKDCEVVGDRVLVRMHVSARGTASGMEVEVESINVWTFDDAGRAVRIDAFFDHEEEEALRVLRGGAD